MPLSWHWDALPVVHVGHDCSFVYDIADLYKAEVTIPIAFEVAAEHPADLPATVRRKVRDQMVSQHILERMVKDIHFLLDDSSIPSEEQQAVYLWDNRKGTVSNGISYHSEEDEEW